MRFCAFALQVCVLAGAARAADVVVVEQIVAKINGDIITRSELERSRRQMEAQLAERAAKDRQAKQQLQQALEQRLKDILRDRIDELLLVQRGKELNINVDTEVSKYVGDIQKQQKIADPEQFAQWIREQTGMSYEDFRGETRNGMLRQRVIGQEVGSKVQVPREDVQRYYQEHKAEFVRQEQVFLREITVKFDPQNAASLAAADKKAKDLAARGKKGERFAEMARDNSDSQTAQQGGDIGSYKKGELRKDIEDLIWDKNKNFVTDPIKSEGFFLILKVEEHFKEGQADFGEVEGEIRDRLFQPLFEPRIREFLTELRRNAFLEIRDGFVDTGAAPGKDTRWADAALLKPETVTKEEVAAQKRLRRLLWAFPVPGTSTGATGKSSSR